MRLPILTAAICLSALNAQRGGAPAFEDYPAPGRYHGKPAAPRFDGPGLPDSKERARESIELQAEEGPNFAGRFTIAHWSCDTGCFRIVVIETATGKLFRDMPFDTLDIGYNHDTEAHRYGGLSFRAASSLLIAEGCFDGETRPTPDCARRFYLWDGARFNLLKSIAIP